MPIVVGGRSMGAALSTLAVLDLKLLYGDKITPYYNMGSPRVGNR